MSHVLTPPTEASRRVESEHAALRDALGVIQKRFGEGPASWEWLSGALNALRQSLEEHFHTEESGGFFDEIVQKDVRFTGEANDLRVEHAAMLGELGSLAARVGGADSDALWDALRSDFHEFSRRLMRHESDESRLLQRAYWDDIGSKD